MFWELEIVWKNHYFLKKKCQKGIKKFFEKGLSVWSWERESFFFLESQRWYIEGKELIYFGKTNKVFRKESKVNLIDESEEE